MATSTQYDQTTLSAIWFKGQIVQGYNPNEYRKDCYGSWMCWNQYGMTTELGWEVDHKIPKSTYGSDAICNLQPLQWENNRKKSDNRW
jgi:5-methylcytosine-specific restriction endonuclease McrA